mmetsp:Transcript_64937/g.154935  ORF Transcript_64937/g.154935 Transcript_64937/m.154935 type:complete len:137 (+) Transcript_64937:149-559(+)
MVKLVLQNDFSPGTGNALQACVASVMELPLNAVPNFITDADPYAALHRFSAEKGLGFFKVETTDGALPFPPSTPDKQVFCILAGKSPRGDHKHAVVGVAKGRSLECLADPHPDATMLEGAPVWAGFFVSLDPSQPR